DKDEELPQAKNKGKAKDFTGMCFMADSVDADDSNEVTPSYDALLVRSNTLFEQLLNQDKALTFVMDRNMELDSQIKDLKLELVNAKDLDADECSSCLALHSELAKLQTAHDSVIHQLENPRTELSEVKSAPCVKCLDSSKLIASSSVASSPCSACLEHEREVKDLLEAARVKYAKL
ncbi:hypothetical protein JGD87_23870, partial [Salmonella enterica subsp. enterica serovar Derby]|nr:hypothetical protein [Salmonella enterica subsp. enterica serovar Derby]